MHDITTEGITFFAAVWLVAFASTIARAVSDAERGGLLRCAGLGATAGFLSVGVIAVCFHSGADSGGFAADFWTSVGIASLIGGLGKEQDKVRTVAWNIVAQAMRAAVDTNKKAD